MKIEFILLIFLLFSCHSRNEIERNTSSSIVGTWQLVSASTIQNDSTHHDDLSGKEMIKIINETHFSFLNHDVKNGKDSTASFVAGGGRYTLINNLYIEHLEYCNYREWEGNKFEFTVEIKGDTLIQSGVEKIKELGVDRKIFETYARFKSTKKNKSHNNQN